MDGVAGHTPAPHGIVQCDQSTANNHDVSILDHADVPGFQLEEEGITIGSSPTSFRDVTSERVGEVCNSYAAVINENGFIQENSVPTPDEHSSVYNGEKVNLPCPRWVQKYLQ